ncbi:MAG: SMP-30/gluconolactonase/LRE family protein [Porticoccaceae bacterium]
MITTELRRPFQLLLMLCFFAVPGVHAQDNCDDQNALCGLTNAEDLIWLPGNERFIASRTTSTEPPGGLYLVDPATRTIETLYPGANSRDVQNNELFPACPSAPDVNNFSTHGLDLKTVGDNHHRLYVTAHGARESVEVFDIDTSGDTPTATWIGCVLMPEDASINAVTILEDGAFYTTRISTQGEPPGAQRMLDGEITGFLYGWRPGEAVVAAVGTEMSGPNGIASSPDGQWLFVAAWGGSEVVRFQRDGTNLTKNASVALPFRPDNLRWTEEGSLLATGHRLGDPDNCDNPGPICVNEWEVAEIHPQDMTVEILATGKPGPGFWAATVALRDKDGLWLGTFRGDRILFEPLGSE